MEEAADEIWQWLENGAAVYMCGDANRMAMDVEKALLNIIATKGGRSEEDAAACSTSGAADPLWACCRLRYGLSHAAGDHGTGVRWTGT